MRYVCMVSFTSPGWAGHKQRFRLVSAATVDEANEMLTEFADRYKASYAHGLLVPRDDAVSDVSRNSLEELYYRLRPSALFMCDEAKICADRAERERRKRQFDEEDCGDDGKQDEPQTPLSEAVLKAAESSPAAKAIRKAEARKAKPTAKPTARGKGKVVGWREQDLRPRPRPKPRPKPRSKAGRR